MTIRHNNQDYFRVAFHNEDKLGKRNMHELRMGLQVAESSFSQMVQGNLHRKHSLVSDQHITNLANLMSTHQTKFENVTNHPAFARLVNLCGGDLRAAEEIAQHIFRGQIEKCATFINRHQRGIKDRCVESVPVTMAYAFSNFNNGIRDCKAKIKGDRETFKTKKLEDRNQKADKIFLGKKGEQPVMTVGDPLNRSRTRERELQRLRYGDDGVPPHEGIRMAGARPQHQSRERSSIIHDLVDIRRHPDYVTQIATEDAQNLMAKLCDNLEQMQAHITNAEELDQANELLNRLESHELNRMGMLEPLPPTTSTQVRLAKTEMSSRLWDAFLTKDPNYVEYHAEVLAILAEDVKEKMDYVLKQARINGTDPKEVSKVCCKIYDDAVKEFESITKTFHYGYNPNQSHILDHMNTGWGSHAFEAFFVTSIPFMLLNLTGLAVPISGVAGAAASGIAAGLTVGRLPFQAAIATIAHQQIGDHVAHYTSEMGVLDPHTPGMNVTPEHKLASEQARRNVAFLAELDRTKLEVLRGQPVTTTNKEILAYIEDPSRRNNFINQVENFRTFLNHQIEVGADRVTRAHQVFGNDSIAHQFMTGGEFGSSLYDLFADLKDSLNKNRTADDKRNGHDPNYDHTNPLSVLRGIPGQHIGASPVNQVQKFQGLLSLIDNVRWCEPFNEDLDIINNAPSPHEKLLIILERLIQSESLTQEQRDNFTERLDNLFNDNGSRQNRTEYQQNFEDFMQSNQRPVAIRPTDTGYLSIKAVAEQMNLESPGYIALVNDPAEAFAKMLATDEFSAGVATAVQWLNGVGTAGNWLVSSAQIATAAAIAGTGTAVAASAGMAAPIALLGIVIGKAAQASGTYIVTQKVKKTAGFGYLSRAIASNIIKSQ